MFHGRAAPRAIMVQRQLVDRVIPALEASWNERMAELRADLEALSTDEERMAVLNAEARSNHGASLAPARLDETGTEMFRKALRQVRIGALQELYEEFGLV